MRSSGPALFNSGFLSFKIFIGIIACCLLVASPSNAGEIKAGYLAGELCLPKKNTEGAVIIIPGSGPINRDGDSAQMRPGMYRQIAEAMAQEGLASVRIDKRGMFGSTSPGIDPNDVTLTLYASDINTWVDRLREETGSPCVWLFGHSEGGLVALKAAQAPEKICGVIAVSTPGRKMGHILREQLQANPANAPLISEAFRIIDKLETGDRIPEQEITPILMPLFYPAIQGFLIDLMRFDPAQAAASLRVPLLIIQGTSDIQITQEDAELLHRANPKSELVLLKEVSHTLKTVPSGPDGMMRTYSEPNLPLADGLIPEISAFIRNSPR